MQVHSKAVNDNTMRVNRLGGSMSGLAAQFQDIDGTAAMGMEAMSGAKRLNDLPDETKEFLVNLRPDEMKTLSEGIRLVGTIRTVATFVKWLIVGILGVVMVGESIGKVLAWLRSRADRQLCSKCRARRSG